MLGKGMKGQGEIFPDERGRVSGGHRVISMLGG
jgi:hypothetical protein